MIRVIVGHRGVGKTSFLERVANYYLKADRPVWTLSLDEFIEREEGRSIGDIFLELGESEFRRLEIKYFLVSMQKARALQALNGVGSVTDVWIATGAGFQGDIPSDVWVIYLRRTTDLKGRVFLDRPRLESNMSPLEEFNLRRQQREQRFLDWANEEIFLPEGFYQSHTAERDLVLSSIQGVEAYITLMPRDIERLKKNSNWWRQRKQWGIKGWELRDDILSLDEIKYAISVFEPQEILLSFRRRSMVNETRLLLKEGMAWDWAHELGPCPWGFPTLLSFHQRPSELALGDFLKEIATFEQKGIQIKVAVPILGFDELLVAHRWAIQKPRQRSFLPQGKGGRWQWYRLLTRGLFPVQFIREGEGSSLDQPTLLQWIHTPKAAWEFAAVLGDPVDHSFSPAEQGPYFLRKGLPFLAVSVDEQEWEQGALAVLWDLGLRFAAVTSPLKGAAFTRAGRVDARAFEFQVVNSLVWEPTEQLWRGGNTDYVGLQAFLASIAERERVVVWGGGGILAPLRKVLPQAQFYSARSGAPREGSCEVQYPDIVIWGTQRKRAQASPPTSWRPRRVVDLNYTEDSLGREWAVEVMAKYDSGRLMFLEQAKAQRKFWGLCGCE